MASKRSARAARISLDEFTQLTFQSVLRASELHKLPPNRFPGRSFSESSGIRKAWPHRGPPVAIRESDRRGSAP
jgi:hypothetical protein